MNKTKQNIRKDQILDAALTVLVQNGYERSRMDDVVQESQLSKGAIYWYYKSKKEMYLDLINFWVLRYSVTLNHIVEEDELPSQQLKNLFQYFINQNEETTIEFPVEAYPVKPKSLNLSKTPEYTGVLKGIKGQYLIFEDQTVFNIRANEGLVVNINSMPS